MLSELHVKNLALIEKADIEFGEGLNILTGETGAGKSIIIGSVTTALGGKVPKDIIRRGDGVRLCGTLIYRNGAGQGARVEGDGRLPG